MQMKDHASKSGGNSQMSGLQHRRGRVGAAVGAGALGLCLALMQPAAFAQTSPAARSSLDDAGTSAAAGQYVDALAALAAAIAAAPDDPGVYAARAQLFDRLGHADLASGDYRTAAKLRPEDVGLQAGLCRTLTLVNHDLDGALAACNAAVRLAPQSADVFSARGYLQLRRAAYAEAEKDYSAALELLPASPDNMFGFGLAIIHLGRVKDGRGEIASATLDSSGVVSDWESRGFGLQGEIRPGRPVTTAFQPVVSVADRKLFLNKDETYVELANGCGRIVPVASAGQHATDANLSWSGACRFGLLHGAGKLTSEAPETRFLYGREMAGEASASAAQKLGLAYQAVEKALIP
jgi:Flp pilus assembly protein TadD